VSEGRSVSSGLSVGTGVVVVVGGETGGSGTVTGNGMTVRTLGRGVVEGGGVGDGDGEGDSRLTSVPRSAETGSSLPMRRMRLPRHDCLAESSFLESVLPHSPTSILGLSLKPLRTATAIIDV
jgi:hypothetical protein